MARSRSTEPRSLEQLVERVKLAAGEPSPSWKSTEIRSPLVLIAPQPLRARRLVDFLRDHLFRSVQSVASYFGGELTTQRSVEPIVQALRSASLFSLSSAVVIFDADSVKKGVAEPLLAALKDAYGETLLILCATELKKTGFVAEAAEIGSTIRLEQLAGPELRRWLEREAQRAGVRLESPAAALLEEWHGSDLSSLSQEVMKLALLVEPGGAITAELVRQASYRTPDVSGFELFLEIGRRNVGRSVALAGSLSEQGLHPLQTLSLLGRCFRTALARRTVENGAKLHSELSNPWYWRNIGAGAELFSEQEMKCSLAELAALDLQLKSSRFPPTLALTVAVQRLASRQFAAE